MLTQTQKENNKTFKQEEKLNNPTDIQLFSSCIAIQKLPNFSLGKKVWGQTQYATVY